MGSAYIRQLNRELEAAAVSAEPITPDLRQRFVEWFSIQPEISRVRRYSMVELERALGTRGRFISPVLLNLGWERHRKWSSTGQSPRYWVPPQDIHRRVSLTSPIASGGNPTLGTYRD